MKPKKCPARARAWDAGPRGRHYRDLIREAGIDGDKGDKKIIAQIGGKFAPLEKSASDSKPDVPYYLPHIMRLSTLCPNNVRRIFGSDPFAIPSRNPPHFFL